MKTPILFSFLLAFVGCGGPESTADSPDWGECTVVGETNAVPPVPICTRTDRASGAVESCKCTCESPHLVVGNDATTVWADITASHSGTATFHAQDRRFGAGFSRHEWSYDCGMARTISVVVRGADGSVCRAEASAGSCP